MEITSVELEQKLRMVKKYWLIFLQIGVHLVKL